MKKVIIVVLILALSATIVGAAVMYKDLREQIQADQLAFLGGLNTGPSETVPEETEPEKQLAPDFTVVDVDGRVHQLSEFRGKPVVLNFWASWCGPCKAEMPVFEEKAAELEGEVSFLMVNLTDGMQESVESAYSFIQTEGYTFPVYYDTYQNAAAAYGVSAIPITFFIDAEGYLTAYASGGIDDAVLQEGIDMICE